MPPSSRIENRVKTDPILKILPSPFGEALGRSHNELNNECIASKTNYGMWNKYGNNKEIFNKRQKVDTWNSCYNTDI